tara:strand:+ start:397 stop:834 length:438 start_codon:yes stop_codon:yes gene_type:complete
MAGFTNKGKAKLLRAFFQSETAPTNVYVYLVTGAVTPTADTNTLSQLTEIAETGKEIQLSLNTTDFPTSVSGSEDDTNDSGIMRIKAIVIAGAITAASYVILTDDNVTEADRIVYAYWSLGSIRTIAASESLTIAGLEFNILETA